MNLEVLQETKVVKGVYTRGYSEYRVVASETTSTYSGGVAVF